MAELGYVTEDEPRDAALVFLQGGFREMSVADLERGLTLTPIEKARVEPFGDEGWRWAHEGLGAWGVVLFASDVGGHLCAMDDQGEDVDALLEYAASLRFELDGGLR